jgi:PEP-CTERM motif
MDTINNKNTKHSVKFLFRTVVVIVMSVLLSSQAMADLYATGVGSGPGAGLSALYTVDPSNGASSLVWNFQGIHIYAGGLAYDNTADTLYATGVEDSSTGTSRLFTINRYTGATTAFGGLSSNINISSGGLAINPVTGVMYATGGVGDPNPNVAHQSTGLLTIDKITGAATLVGYAAGNCCTGNFGIMLNGLGFRSDGTLFANGFSLAQPDSSTSHLYTVDLATGAATDIGPSGVILGGSLKYSGLAFSGNGTLLSLGSLDAASGALYSVNTFNGAATSLSGTGLPYGSGPIHFGVDGGLAFAPAVPEPETYAMLLAGLGLIGFIAYRRKNDSSGMPMAA